MAPLRHLLFLAVLVLVVGSVLAGIWYVVLPARCAGAETRSGSVSYRLDPADYWRYTRTLETRLLLTDARGITRCAEAPIVGVEVRDPVTGQLSRLAIDVSPKLVHEDTLVWNLMLKIPEGREYIGAYLEEGSYKDMSGRLHEIWWSSGYEEE
jgi:hypothetical protein